MKELPIFSIQQSNRLGDYIRFRHTKSYISGKSQFHPSNQEIMASIGYGSLPKFKNHRKEWDDLSRRIPTKYLAAIQADIEVLRFTLELDQEEYDKALEIPFFPKSAGIRLMAAVYSTIEFPADTSEAEAIEILKRYSRENGRYCFITCASIKTIYVQPDGTVFTTLYRPELEINKTWVVASDSGKKVGVVSIR